VYNRPLVVFPPPSYEFNLKENITYNLTFTINHSIGDNLTYEFYITKNNISILRYNLSYYGNNTNLTWSFTPNFTDETYSNKTNLSLFISNDLYPQLNFSSTWNLTINHTNYNLSFFSEIENKTGVASPYQMLLSNYFKDLDASDSMLYQSIGFNYSWISGGTGITVRVVNWTNGAIPTITFSSTDDSSGVFRITAFEFNESNNSQIISEIKSNNFSISLTGEGVAAAPAPASTGGGGNMKESLKVISVKIVVPQDILIPNQNLIQIPFQIQNNGQTTLKGITLSSVILYNNELAGDVKITLPLTYIDELPQGKSRNLTMNIYADTTKSGKYKATLYANVSSPKFFDWGDFYIQLTKTNESEAEKLLAFTEKLIVENPECIELTEVVKDARKAFDEGNYDLSKQKTDEAITACEDAIQQKGTLQYATNYVKDKFYYVLFATLAIFAFGLILYVYKRVRFNKFKREEYIGT